LKGRSASITRSSSGTRLKSDWWYFSTMWTRKLARNTRTADTSTGSSSPLESVRGVHIDNVSVFVRERLQTNSKNISCRHSSSEGDIAVAQRGLGSCHLPWLIAWNDRSRAVLDSNLIRSRNLMPVERALAKEVWFGVGRYCSNHRRSLRTSQHCGNVLLGLSLHLGSDYEVHPGRSLVVPLHVLGTFALTEADHGSDPDGMKTKAVRDGNGYLLNGSKMWITSGSIADVAMVWAKLDGIIRGFLVEKKTAGFSAHDIKSKLSMRASITSELVFEDVRVPVENLLPKAEGLKAPLQCLTQGRYGIAWGALGAAMSCFEAAHAYTCERKQFGKPIASFQLTQAKLADMVTEITKAQLLCLKLGRLKDAGQMRHTQVSLAKRNNVRMALEVARTARGMLGANGISDEYPVMRHMCNLETVETYEGTYEIHTLILGKDLTGLDALS